MIRKSQKQQTKAKVLQTALEEFSRGGLLTTKTLDIAKAADLSHGTIFVHFPTKEALMLAVINEFGMHLGIELKNKMKRGDLKSVLSTFISVLRLWEPFYTQLVICAPHLHEDIRTAIFNIQSGIAFYLGQALSQEGVPAKLPLHLVLNTWLGLVHYYLTNRELFSPKGSVLAEKGTELIQFFNQLIKGDTNE
ncbi:MAG: TetR/AcrR family transcriptional regulator [Verrucomicrobia bacterium]|nr:TetR/AcrR family transcriptional regulator [Verrucomicrobiota bacterium]